METDYSRELAEYTELAEEEVSIAFDSGEPYDQVRAWFLAKFAKTARNIISRKIELVEKGITAIPAHRVMVFSFASTEGTRQ